MSSSVRILDYLLHLCVDICRHDGTIVLTRDGEEPELMAKMATKICVSLDEVRAFLGKPATQAVAA